MAALRIQNEPALLRAKELFTEAVARDPDYLEARAALAWSCFALAYRAASGHAGLWRGEA
jgi:hypothetical protein